MASKPGPESISPAELKDLRKDFFAATKRHNKAAITLKSVQDTNLQLNHQAHHMPPASSVPEPSVALWRKENRTLESLKKELKGIKSVKCRMEDEILKLQKENQELQSAKDKEVNKAVDRNDFIDLAAQDDILRPLIRDFGKEIKRHNQAASSLGEAQRENRKWKPEAHHMEPADQMEEPDVEGWKADHTFMGFKKKSLKKIKRMTTIMEAEARRLTEENRQLEEAR